MSTTDKPTMFAVVELFGHARIAGAVSEQTFGGSTFVRVDVPEIRFKETDYDAPTAPGGGYRQRERAIPAHTRSFGAGAIYSINWCDQATCIHAANSIRHEPLKPYSVREALEASRGSVLDRLPAPAGEVDDDQPY